MLIEQYFEYLFAINSSKGAEITVRATEGIVTGTWSSRMGRIPTKWKGEKQVRLAMRRMMPCTKEAESTKALLLLLLEVEKWLR